MENFDPIAYINEVTWSTSRLGLDRVRELLERLGRPQDRLRFVHVAGTNGKGSTCAFLARILECAGYRTGLFTSPAIVDFTDRIRVNGRNISPDELREVTWQVREQAEQMADHPTEFELLTAVAFLHFVRQGCDVCVVEVGLGGQLDSTNVIEAPEASVIVPIAMDHTQLLGSTLAEIAQVKAGIVKPGSPVVCAPQPPEALAVIAAAAVANQAPLTCVDADRIYGTAEDFTYVGQYAHAGIAGGSEGDGLAADSAPVVDSAPAADGLVAGDLAVDSAPTADGPAPATPSPNAPAPNTPSPLRHLKLGLLGSYQPQNAATVLEVVGVLRARGWAIPDSAVREGLATTRWPGRFEVLSEIPPFVVDGGHNPQGAQVLIESLEQRYPEYPVIFVMGVLADKDYAAMVRSVVSYPYTRAVFCIEPPNDRALPTGELARAVNDEVARQNAEAGRRHFFLRPVHEVMVREAISLEKGVEAAAGIALSLTTTLEGEIPGGTPTDPFALFSGWSVAASYDNPVVVAFGSLYSVAAVTQAFRSWEAATFVEDDSQEG